MTVYLANAFSLNMLPSAKRVKIEVTELGKTVFCVQLRNYRPENAIGHESTVQLVNELCGTDYKVNRAQIKLGTDTVFVVQVSERLPEGKVLTKDEILKLYNEGKIKFYRVDVVEVEE